MLALSDLSIAVVSGLLASLGYIYLQIWIYLYIQFQSLVTPFPRFLNESLQVATLQISAAEFFCQAFLLQKEKQQH